MHTFIFIFKISNVRDRYKRIPEYQGVRTYEYIEYYLAQSIYLTHIKSVRGASQ